VGISYRHAWVLVQEVNEAAGEPLVTASPGGRHGGGATLTGSGRLAVRLCRGLQEQLQQAATSMLPPVASDQDALHVAAAVSLEEVLAALVTDHARRYPQTRVRVVLGASDELADLVRTGAGVDVLLTADKGHLDALTAEGVVQADTVTTLAENALAAIAPADFGARVRRPADLLGSAVTRVALAAPSCPLGAYSRAYLGQVGLYDLLLERAILVDHSRAVVAAVRAGQAEAGLVYTSATATAQGCRVLFRVRRPAFAIRYAGAVVRRSPRPEQARRFLELLASAEAAQRFRSFGFLPIRRPVLTAATPLPPGAGS
jgi:molybdate transport system substrate-binding protein